MSDNQGKKILAVDDEQAILDFTDQQLKSLGFEVIKVSKAGQVVETVINEKPDLILLDVSMPDGDGVSVCKKLRENPNYDSVPIIMLTGLVDESVIVSALEGGADDYITKPYKKDELLVKVNGLLRKAEEGVLPRQLLSKKTKLPRT